MTEQMVLFDAGTAVPSITVDRTTVFSDNLDLPVHRWFRYSAGFNANWVEEVIREHSAKAVLDPFVGSGTTLLAAEKVGVEAWGIEAHPFIFRVAAAKLAWRSDPEVFRTTALRVLEAARCKEGSPIRYPPLIRQCFDDVVLAELDAIRYACETASDGTAASQLIWLALVGILRKCSKVGTAQWQYVLPKKRKVNVARPFSAFRSAMNTIYQDMEHNKSAHSPAAKLILGDARTCDELPEKRFDLVITSPPYPNNYDYADATRLEMSFLGEIGGWGDLQRMVRQYLVRSCTQTVPERAVDLLRTCSDPFLAPIRDELTVACEKLAEVRKSKGGKKTYHLMAASYFLDLAKTWRALRRVCRESSRVCFVVGDSAPYGIYLPVIPWLGSLALAAGFQSFHFDKTRDRNVKWKNRKHRVPLQEGRLWVEG